MSPVRKDITPKDFNANCAFRDPFPATPQKCVIRANEESMRPTMGKMRVSDVQTMLSAL